MTAEIEPGGVPQGRRGELVIPSSAQIGVALEKLKGYGPVPLKMVYYKLVHKGEISNHPAAVAELRKVLIGALDENPSLGEAIIDASPDVNGRNGPPGHLSLQLFDFDAQARSAHLQTQLGVAFEIWSDKPLLWPVQCGIALRWNAFVHFVGDREQFAYEAAKRIDERFERGITTVVMPVFDRYRRKELGAWPLIPRVRALLAAPDAMKSVSGMVCGNQARDWPIPINPYYLHSAGRNRDLLPMFEVEAAGPMFIHLLAYRHIRGRMATLQRAQRRYLKMARLCGEFSESGHLNS